MYSGAARSDYAVSPLFPDRDYGCPCSSRHLASGISYLHRLLRFHKKEKSGEKIGAVSEQAIDRDIRKMEAAYEKM